MAAKLTWFNDGLYLGGTGGWVLAALKKEGDRWRVVLNRVAWRATEHQSKNDARQDCEAEVRRLLKAAGVEVP